MRLLYFDIKPDVLVLKQMHLLRLMVSNLPDCVHQQEAQRLRNVHTLECNMWSCQCSLLPALWIYVLQAYAQLSNTTR